MEHEENCTYEVCKLAKEKGFKVECEAFYYNDGSLQYAKFEDWNGRYLNKFSAPTQSLLQRWLREAYAIDIDIYPIFPAGEPHKREYGCQVYAVGKSNKPFRIGYAKTYENMLESALKYALENLV